MQNDVVNITLYITSLVLPNLNKTVNHRIDSLKILLSVHKDYPSLPRSQGQAPDGALASLAALTAVSLRNGRAA